MVGKKTADLCDQFEAEIQVAEPMLGDFGGLTQFSGPIATIKVYEDNALIKKRLEEDGKGRVLVIDGAGSTRTALVGDKLAGLAEKNNWAGLVIHGCIRDVEEVSDLDLGVKALGTTPRKSAKRGSGEIDVVVYFAGVSFTPGHYLYADPDGIVVAPRELG
jgi:regulator of ribonuclease activity A